MESRFGARTGGEGGAARRPGRLRHPPPLPPRARRRPPGLAPAPRGGGSAGRAAPAPPVTHAPGPGPTRPRHGRPRALRLPRHPPQARACRSPPMCLRDPIKHTVSEQKDLDDCLRGRHLVEL